MTKMTRGNPLHLLTEVPPPKPYILIPIFLSRPEPTLSSTLHATGTMILPSFQKTITLQHENTKIIDILINPEVYLINIFN